MNVMNEPSPTPDLSEAELSDGRAFRAELNQKLRAPLNAIIGFAELLAMRPGGSATKEADVQHILKAARDLLGIINEELGEGGPGDRPEAKTIAVASCDVLYIEDDPVNFTLVERILEFRPTLTLMHARTGNDGVDLAHAYRPRLILLDLNLPDMNGSEVLRRLKN